MSIPLYNIIELMYPEIDMSDIDRVQISEVGGQQFIGYWDIPNITKPSKTEINKFSKLVSTQKAYQASVNRITNKTILKQLDALDLKAIRPLMENDTVRLDDLNQQKAQLRSQLLPTNPDMIVLN